MRERYRLALSRIGGTVGKVLASMPRGTNKLGMVMSGHLMEMNKAEELPRYLDLPNVHYFDVAADQRPISD